MTRCPGCEWDHLGANRLAEQLGRLDAGWEHPAELADVTIATLNRWKDHPAIAVEAGRRRGHYQALADQFTTGSTP